jgi:threonine/homoserine/homoserine lactone efflux protein
LTISNPMTILSFVAVFAGLGVVVGSSYASVALLVLAVFAGSAAWWLLLVGLVGWLRLRLSADVLRWVNRLSGVLICAFGLLAIVSLLA